VELKNKNIIERIEIINNLSANTERITCGIKK
jgi:hypothetical protein